MTNLGRMHGKVPLEYRYTKRHRVAIGTLYSTLERYGKQHDAVEHANQRYRIQPAVLELDARLKHYSF